MAASRSWPIGALRGLSLSVKRPQRPARFWALCLGVLTSTLVIALLLMGSPHLPNLPSLSAPPTHAHRPDGPVVVDGMRVWEPPVMDPLVHGQRVSDAIKKKPTYPLLPFPPSPMANPPPDDRQRPWLGAVICSAWDVKRRMLIRYTWMKMFAGVPMDQRFVISNPGRAWTDVIRQENRTFGDMIVLDHLPEDDFTANTVKTIEFYRWLVEKSPRKYEFVSKMDTDLFVNARAMYDRQIAPRLARKFQADPARNASAAAVNETVHVPDYESRDAAALTATVNRTLIGQFYYDGYHNTSFPHGAIYTVTWDMVELLPRLQDEFHVIAGEDVTMAWLLMKGKQKVTMAILSESEKFEFDNRDRRPGDDSAWARNGTDTTSRSHALFGTDVLAVHQLKRDDDWLRVAECFDENGIKAMPPDPMNPLPENDDKPRYPRPFFTFIPDDFWEVDRDGAMLCNGVWKLEPGMGRDMKKTGD
ncbi:glycosyltransferase family 31 protein [Trichocladium antarcticum]|uniref:Hexosyltransferase n=1 Tax=Trichocladium antarcticum TaxID=1450529 RepID=A0AAN6UDE2_9PEZI|nr:glycosyltransferase family 31 protein [Trichocladium antarcticum]